MKQFDEIALKEVDRRAIEAASAILRQRFPIERVVLFGSKARGDDAPESDIDLLILTSRKLGGDERGHIIDALFDLQLELDVIISTVVVSREDWEHGVYQAMPLHEEVERDGATV